jgi:hypothetical protein
VLELLDRHPDDVRYEQVVANLALAGLSLHACRLDDAEPLATRARELAGQFPTTDPFLHGRALILAARLRASRGDFASADALLGQARQALAGLPQHHPMVMEADVAHAGRAAMRGDTAEAVRLARESAGRIERAGGERSPWLPQALCFLAEQLHLAGDFTESEKVYERALDIQRRRRGADHPDLVTSLRGLARLHLSRGNALAAEVRFRQALEICINGLGDNHPDTAESLNDLASLRQQLGDLLTAEALFRRALAIRCECLGANHHETLTSQHNLALVLAGRGETAEAADLLEKAVALTELGTPRGRSCSTPWRCSATPGAKGSGRWTYSAERSQPRRRPWATAMPRSSPYCGTWHGGRALGGSGWGGAQPAVRVSHSQRPQAMSQVWLDRTP